MKKIYLLIFVPLLAVALAIGCAAISAAGKINVDPDRFMCRTFLSESADFFEREDDSLLISFRNGAPVVEVISPDLSGAESGNAVRIVLKNNSTCNALIFSYTVGEDVKTARVPITRRGDKEAYYVYPENVAEMRDITLSFTGAYNGTVELYSMGIVSVYDDSAEQPGSIQDCIYDPKSHTVRISGTIGHSIAVSARNATVELYAFGSHIEVTPQRISTAAPLAKAPLSVRFEFEVACEYFSDRFLQYAVAIISSDGRVLYVYTPRYPCIKTVDDGDTEPFKGVYTQYTTLANRSDVGMAIVDVYLDRLQSPQKNGIPHIVDGRYYYIDRSYVHELDGVIRKYGADGVCVYLRFLSTAEEREESEGDITFFGLSLSRDVERRTLFAYTDFLCSRYSGREYGEVTGIVISRSLDRAAEFGHATAADLAAYTVLCADAIYTVSQAAREDGRNVEVIVPVSSRLEDGTSPMKADGNYSPTLFLTSLCKILDSRYGEGLSVRVMLEDSTVPSALLDKTVDPQVFSAENADVLESFLSSLTTVYQRFDGTYLYYWMPDGEVRGDTLINAYVYVYYKLLFAGADGVILSTEELDRTTDVRWLFDTVKYIDTQIGADKNILTPDAFGVEDWSELIPEFDAETVAARNIFIYENYKIPSSEIRGSYIMWDYKQGRSAYDWHTDNGTDPIVRDVASMGQMLTVSLTPSSEQAGYSELIYDYSAVDIMSVVDMLSVDVLIDGETGTRYELKFEICGDKSSCEVSATVESGVLTTVYLSTLKLDKTDRVCNIRIFSAPLSGEQPYKLCVAALSAHSNSLNDKALAEAIVEARLAAREPFEEPQGQAADIRLGALLISVVLCISAFILIALARKRDENP